MLYNEKIELSSFFSTALFRLFVQKTVYGKLLEHQMIFQKNNNHMWQIFRYLAKIDLGHNL
jgi:hypothetical protein